jgi:hypothetical protein
VATLAHAGRSPQRHPLERLRDRDGPRGETLRSHRRTSLACSSRALSRVCGTVHAGGRRCIRGNVFCFTHVDHRRSPVGPRHVLVGPDDVSLRHLRGGRNCMDQFRRQPWWTCKPPLIGRARTLSEGSSDAALIMLAILAFIGASILLVMPRRRLYAPAESTAKADLSSASREARVLPVDAERAGNRRVWKRACRVNDRHQDR